MKPDNILLDDDGTGNIWSVLMNVWKLYITLQAMYESVIWDWLCTFQRANQCEGVLEL